MWVTYGTFICSNVEISVSRTCHVSGLEFQKPVDTFIKIPFTSGYLKCSTWLKSFLHREVENIIQYITKTFFLQICGPATFIKQNFADAVKITWYPFSLTVASVQILLKDFKCFAFYYHFVRYAFSLIKTIILSLNAVYCYYPQFCRNFQVAFVFPIGYHYLELRDWNSKMLDRKLIVINNNNFRQNIFEVKIGCVF